MRHRPDFQSAKAGSEDEENDQCDHEAEQAGGFGKGKAQQQVRELACGSCRVAQSACQVVTEDVTDTNTGTGESDSGKARTDQFSCICFPGNNSSVKSNDWLMISDAC